ncbi:hypothetical protein [uncultured Paludibaculum sp.]|uniref:hypothetical protein n=1 Tax=uncultured Paludibaculum sp. TaxID=1765020 RepID=UPI002AAACF45|nr:hypothetical protein [uncultured Paludibaculum sp.]
MRRPSGFIALVFVVLAPAFAQLPEEVARKFAEAEKRIVRLPPTAFPELPGQVVRALQRRGCTIPQPALATSPHNVLKGEFAKPGQTDWAVLCSVKGVSRILVFWNGSEKDPAAIASSEDRNYLQGISETAIGYSRGISAVGKDVIERHHRAYGGPTPPPIDHQGIDDAFLEKASVTWYFHGGRWMKLTGSD